MKYINNVRVCTVEGCERKHRSNGYCAMHNDRFKRHGSPHAVLKPVAKHIGCMVEGCDGEHYAKRYCVKHYARFKKHGDPSKVLHVIGKYDKCTVDGCRKKHVSKGYCSTHYQRFRIHGSPHKLLINKGNEFVKCKIEGCEKRSRTNGMCPMHVARVFRHGNPHYTSRTYGVKKCFVEDCNNDTHVRVSRNVKRNEKYCIDHLYKNEEHKERNHKRRASKKNAPINDFVKKDWLECFEHFDKSCAYCGGREAIQVEHIVPLSLHGSHTKENIIPACASCNGSKQDVLVEIWYPQQPFYDREREKKILKWMGYKIHENKIQMQLF